MDKIGFIGMGNMGSAMMRGLLKKADVTDMLFTVAHEEHAKEIFKETGVMYCDSNAELASKCKYIVLAVKPVVYPKVLKNIQDIVKRDNVIISLAPGVSIDQLKEKLGIDRRIVRAMPNTPASPLEIMETVFPSMAASMAMRQRSASLRMAVVRYSFSGNRGLTRSTYTP